MRKVNFPLRERLKANLAITIGLLRAFLKMVFGNQGGIVSVKTQALLEVVAIVAIAAVMAAALALFAYGFNCIATGRCP